MPVMGRYKMKKRKQRTVRMDAWALLKVKKDEIQVISDGYVVQMCVYASELSAKKEANRDTHIKSRIVPIKLIIPVRKP